MGRFSQVQAFADHHNAVHKVAYEQVASASAAATETRSSSSSFTAPEKVINPYGSTAGAGSGDFHVYRHARNRELQRQAQMESAAVQEQMDAAFAAQQAQQRTEEQARTAKRRKQRERQKNAKKRKENLIKAGIGLPQSTVGVNNSTEDFDSAEEEFHYTPGEIWKDDDTKSTKVDDPVDSQSSNTLVATSIPNDGSFLEMMKKKLQQQQSPDSLPNDQKQPADGK